ncbi:MAG: hypothetical protein CMH98_02825 [Oceanospirillaceae bacterium]|nr:hypothetical protein [Oceanospirillaceae bacterium]|tara:strand:+ start:166599 stop:167468 length:870 start_codon:yes stop_codon:yes gene_type:complete
MTDSAANLITPASSQNFQRLLLASDLVLVEFRADWCAPCKALLPVLQNIAADYAGQLLLVTVDADQEAGLCQKYAVRSLPGVLLFRRGKKVQQWHGIVPESRIRQTLESCLPPDYQQTLASVTEAQRLGQWQQALTLLKPAYDKAPERPEFVLAITQTLAALAAENNDASYLEEAANRLQQCSAEVLREPALAQWQTRLQLIRQLQAEFGELFPDLHTLMDPFDPGDSVDGERLAPLRETLDSLLHRAQSGADADGQHRARTLLVMLLNTMADRTLAQTYRRRLCGSDE